MRFVDREKSAVSRPDVDWLLLAERGPEDILDRPRESQRRAGPQRLQRRVKRSRLVVDGKDTKKQDAAHRAGDRGASLNPAFRLPSEEWRSILEWTPDLVVLMSRKGLIWYVNRVPAWLGANRESVVGSSICDFLAPGSRGRVQESVERVFQTGEAIRQVICFSTNGRGTLRGEASIGPVARSGRTVAGGMFFTDTTKQEEVLRRLQERETLLRSIVRAVPKMMVILEGVIRDGGNTGEAGPRVPELGFCREQMIQLGRLASVGKVNSSLTQRLPQFLTAIGMSVENARVELDSTSRHNGVGRGLEAALQAVAALTDRVEEVRRFSVTNSRRALIHAVDLPAILTRIVQLLDMPARAANMVICIDHLARLPQICMAEGDAEQLFFALIDHLLGLADGKKQHHIKISGVVRADQVELRVAGDSNLGDEENLDLSVDYSLAPTSCVRAADLGLCVASDIVVQAGGSIRRERAAGMGPTFLVVLPIAGAVGVQRD